MLFVCLFFKERPSSFLPPSQIQPILQGQDQVLHSLWDHLLMLHHFATHWLLLLLSAMVPMGKNPTIVSLEKTAAEENPHITLQVICPKIIYFTVTQKAIYKLITLSARKMVCGCLKTMIFCIMQSNINILNGFCG